MTPTKTLMIKELETTYDVSVLHVKPGRAKELHHLATFAKTLGAMTLMLGAIRAAADALMIDDLVVDGYSNKNDQLMAFLRNSGMEITADYEHTGNVVPLNGRAH